jgi:hypothetical protein
MRLKIPVPQESPLSKSLAIRPDPAPTQDPLSSAAAESLLRGVCHRRVQAYESPFRIAELGSTVIDAAERDPEIAAMYSRLQKGYS